jgi:hypothetical protein
VGGRGGYLPPRCPYSERKTHKGVNIPCASSLAFFVRATQPSSSTHNSKSHMFSIPFFSLYLSFLSFFFGVVFLYMVVVLCLYTISIASHTDICWMESG